MPTQAQRDAALAFVAEQGGKTWRQLMMDDAGHTEFSEQCGATHVLITSRWHEPYSIEHDDLILSLLQTPADCFGALLPTLKTRCDPRAWARVVEIERVAQDPKLAAKLLEKAPFRSEEYPSGVDGDEIELLLDAVETGAPDRFDALFRQVELHRAGLKAEG